MKQKVTIQDIANMVNVSKSSVSRYLNNGYVSEENAKKIYQLLTNPKIYNEMSESCKEYVTKYSISNQISELEKYCL